MTIVSDTQVIAALIAAAAVLGVPAITSFLTKKKEREAEWRTQKLEHYKTFMSALNAIVGPPPSVRERVAFADAANNIFLVGSAGVLVALRNYLDASADSAAPPTRSHHDQLLTKLIIEIRSDISAKEAPLPKDYIFHLWAGKPLT